MAWIAHFIWDKVKQELIEDLILGDMDIIYIYWTLSYLLVYSEYFVNVFQGVRKEIS